MRMSMMQFYTTFPGIEDWSEHINLHNESKRTRNANICVYRRMDVLTQGQNMCTTWSNRKKCLQQTLISLLTSIHFSYSSQRAHRAYRVSGTSTSTCTNKPAWTTTATTTNKAPWTTATTTNKPAWTTATTTNKPPWTTASSGNANFDHFCVSYHKNPNKVMNELENPLKTNRVRDQWWY